MSTWRPQHYRAKGLSTEDSSIIENAIAVGEITQAINPKLPPIFTLRHLSEMSGVDFGILRDIVARAFKDSYRTFRIQKRPAFRGERRYRVIAVPTPPLLKVQRWITSNVLSFATPHNASVAFSKGDTLIGATELHCGCKWLIKLDVCKFFESISEIAVYRIFRSLGYQPLVSFELARLCTRSSQNSCLSSRWNIRAGRTYTISSYYHPNRALGHLPQGAPTSPMLGNLAMIGFDREASSIAQKFGMAYSRYADDIALSTRRSDFSRDQCRLITKAIYGLMTKFGLSPNISKTRVSSPGARKVVLGLLVDGPKPRLTRDFKANMRQHLHYLTSAKFGPTQHSIAKGFASIAGLRNHLYGLATFASQIEPSYGFQCKKTLDKVAWPI